MSGDQNAFGVLFSRHRERLWAVAVRTLGDPDDAADALQDAMISAFRRAGVIFLVSCSAMGLATGLPAWGAVLLLAFLVLRTT